MIRMPAHKNTINPPGQVQIKEDKTLKDYIERKMAEPKKKLTFYEWWTEHRVQYSLDDPDSMVSNFERCWQAAQENK